MRVLICGGTDFRDYALLRRKCDELIPESVSVEIVSGGARGADTMAERYAAAKGYGLSAFEAKWSLYGKAAGPIRNRKMIDYICEDNERIVIAFWNGSSRGTMNTIVTALRLGLRVEIIYY